MTDLVVLRHFASEAEAELAAAVLKANGVAAAVFHNSDNTDVLRLGLAGPANVVVAPEDVELATQLLDTEANIKPR